MAVVHRVSVYFMTLLQRWRRLRGGDGVLATKFGYNPNSSSLGVDVTFLLFGISAIAMLTPVISLLVRGGAARTDPKDSAPT